MSRRMLPTYSSSSRVKTILKKEKKQYTNAIKKQKDSFLVTHLDLVRLLKERKDFYKDGGKDREMDNEENEGYESVISNLQWQIENLKEQIANQDNSNAYKSAPAPVSIVKEPENTNGRNSLYFTIPENGGCFISDKAESTDDGRKFYKIEFSQHSNQGKLFFISSDNDKRAINRIETYLKPVCDIENILHAEKANKVEMLSPGKVTLANNAWVIDNNHKVKVKLL